MSPKRPEVLRILLLAANPANTATLRLDREARDIEEVLQRAKVPSEVRHVTAVRPRDLPHSIRLFRPNVVHFSGHGEKNGGILLEGPRGLATPVPKEALAALFELFTGVQCVFLNSCYSRDHAQAIARHVPFVIGLTETISDRAAIEFAFGFYQAIGDGESIPAAFQYGKVAIGLANLANESAIPVFFSGRGEGKGSAEVNDSGFPTGMGRPRIPRVENTRARILSPTPRSADFAELPAVTSKEQLTELSWKEFELLSLHVVASMYQGTTLELTHALHSDSKDAEAQYILGVNFDKNSRTSLRVWLELKQRKQRIVGKSDVASHIVDAMASGVTKIILITNRAFSLAVDDWLADFAVRTGLQYQLIDGQTLFEHARALLLPSPPILGAADTPGSGHASPDVTILSWFTLSPYDYRPPTLRRTLVTARPDRPLYLIVEATLHNDLQPIQIAVRVRGPAPWAPARLAWPAASQPMSQLAGVGERMRQCFLIWPDPSLAPSLDDIGIGVESNRPLLTDHSALNSARLPTFTLAPTHLRSQSGVVDSIKESLDTFSRDASSVTTLLVAPAGIGKSHVLSMVRQHCHAAGLYEIFLDCEMVRTDVDFLRSLLRALLPFPPALLDSGLLEPLRQWCIQAGITREAAAQVAQDLCGGETSRNQAIGIGHRLEIAQALLTSRSVGGHLALFIEDLHKAAPSLLALLSSLTSRLATSGDSGLFVFATTRPFVAGVPDLRAEWLAALSAIGNSARTIVLHMTPPDRCEAREILQSSIVALEDHHAEVILDAVGTSPFALREAVLFLLARATLLVAQFDGRRVLSVADPGRLSLVLSSRELARATEERLKLLFDNQPSWFHELLLGGAVYGRRFPFRSLIAALRLEDDMTLAYALDTSARWSILSSSTDSLDWVEFDHDLVRESLLTLGPRRARRTVAKKFLQHLGTEAEPQVQCRLAYQAGLAEDCLAAAKVSKMQAQREGRVADLIELNQLIVQVLDPEVAAGILAELLKTGEQSLIDPALRSADPPEVTSLTADERLRLVLDLLIENIECLAAVGSGSSGATAVAISEARLIAERLGDGKRTAHLLYFEGRLWFERNALPRAISLHQQAESEFALQGLKRSSARTENLVRYAICMRRQGDVDESLALLWTAAKQCPTGNWTLLNKVRNNFGAAYLHSDWSRVRYHWERQVHQATRRGLFLRKVHGLASLSFIDLFEGRLEEGSAKAREALELGEKLRLDNQVVRLSLHLSVHAIMANRAQEARTYLLKAEQLALRHAIGRRLWRVTANLATVDELLALRQSAFARDLQTLCELESSFTDPQAGGRELLPLVNVLLRAKVDRSFEALLAKVPAIHLAVAQSYSELVLMNRAQELPRLLGNYCVKLPVGMRFLLSE